MENESNSFLVSGTRIIDLTVDQLENLLTTHVQAAIRDALNNQLRPVEIPDEIRLKEAAKLLNRSIDWMYQQTFRGLLPVKSRLGKELIFSRAALTSWLNERTIVKPLKEKIADNQIKAVAQRRAV